MAIAGLLVHTLLDNLKDAEAKIASMPGMTTYGTYQDQYVVVVAEAASDEMETHVAGIEKVEGVLAVYTTYVSIEDELAAVQA